MITGFPLLAFLRYNPIVRVHLGPFSISPHGVGIAGGFMLGSALVLRAAERKGMTAEQIYPLITRAAIGSMIGARVAYVMNHFGSYHNPLDIFKVWEGGISLLGGIAGAILLGLPKIRSQGLSFWRVLDVALPGVTFGIALGRLGDLVIADHLGKPTKFFLGYVCPSVETGSPCAAAVGHAVHQPALYDMFSASLLFGLFMILRRRDRYDGFLTLVFGVWYGMGRLIEDFFRIDVTHGTGLTGSQWTAVMVIALCAYALVFMHRTPWASGQGDQRSVPQHRQGDPGIVDATRS